MFTSVYIQEKLRQEWWHRNVPNCLQEDSSHDNSSCRHIFCYLVEREQHNQLSSWPTCYTRVLLNCLPLVQGTCKLNGTIQFRSGLVSIKFLPIPLLSSSLFPTVLELRLRTLCTLGKYTAAELHPQPKIHIFKEWLLKPEVYSALWGFYNSNVIKYRVFWTRQSGVHTVGLK